MRAKRSLERDIMLGQVEGNRKQGKPGMRWLDSIKEANRPTVGRPRRSSTREEKMVCAGGRKDSE